MLGSVSDVRRISGVTGEELIDTEIQSFLDEATRTIQAEFGKDYMIDRFFIHSIAETGEIQRTYNLYFPIKAGSDRTVYKNGKELTENTDYTINETNSQLILDNSLSLVEGDLVAILYYPQIFDDYANYLASMNIIATRLVNMPTGNTAVAVMDNFQKVIDNIRNQIKKKPYVLSWLDHYEDTGIW